MEYLTGACRTSAGDVRNAWMRIEKDLRMDIDARG